MIFSVGVFSLSLETLQRGARTDLQQEALFYAQEGLEATRSIRDRNFLELTNGDHGLALVSDQWTFIPAPEDIDGFYERTLTVEDVYRDTGGEIDPAGTFDAETKKVTSEVAWLWKSTTPQSVTLTTYFTNWTGDDWLQTTCTEWNTGTFDQVEAVITVSPPADNCGLTLLEVESASAFFESADIGEHGRDVVVDGSYAYVASAKSNEGLVIVDISDPENPTIVRRVDVGGKGRYVSKSGNYVYVGVEKSSGGLAIVDVTTPATATQVSSLNIGAEGNQSVASGNILYMGVEKDSGGFVIIDITNKSFPLVTKTVNLSTKVRVINLNGNYIYAGVIDDTLGVRVIDVAVPASASQVASLSVGEEVNAISIQGAVAYVGTEDGDESLHVISISNPLSLSEITSVDVGGEIQDLVTSGDYLYAAIDENDSGLAAINIEVPTAPYLVFNLDIEGKATGIDEDGIYVYATLDVNNRGVVILGTVEAGVITEGTYVSTAVDTGSTDTRYDFIEWEQSEIPNGSAELQIRTASSVAGLSSATWVGSDGTAATTYENSRTPIVLDAARSGQRYFQVKAILQSDGVNTPTVESIRVNYTP